MIKVAIIGLDTSHAIEFARRMQAHDCPPDQKVAGMKAISCLRFKTPFQTQEGLDKRQEQLEKWGVKVTTNFAEAIDGCDAIMLEINDPAYHLDYFKKVAHLKKPIFLDKPMCDTLPNARAILQLASKYKTRVFSASSVPFCNEVSAVKKLFSKIENAIVYGAYGKAATGDSLVWYGVHTFELLLHIMGTDPRTIRAIETKNSATIVVGYNENREGLIRIIKGNWFYGGTLIGTAANDPNNKLLKEFKCDMTYSYKNLLSKIKAFFEGKDEPVPFLTTFTGQAMMIAARRAIKTGRTCTVGKP
jgi:predicted dehydrogenase